jgi:putative membrane protein
MTNTKSNTLLWLVIALVVSVAAMAMIGALAFSGSDGDYMMMGGGWGWAMALMVVPGIILTLILIVALGGLEAKPVYNAYPVHAPPQPSPLDILNQRFARGEISQDEYERMKAALGR